MFALRYTHTHILPLVEAGLDRKNDPLSLDCIQDVKLFDYTFDFIKFKLNYVAPKTSCLCIMKKWRANIELYRFWISYPTLLPHSLALSLFVSWRNNHSSFLHKLVLHERTHLF